MSVASDIKKDPLTDVDRPESFDLTDALPSRPAMVYSSPGAFAKSFARRWKSIWTRRFALALFSGQVVSLCITCTNVTTTELVNRNWALPTTQTFFLYFSLFAIYTPYTMYQYGLRGWGNMVLRDGWKYFILAACDVEGNFLVVKGVLICVAGLGLLVVSDQITDKDWTALNRAKGDGFMIAGATLYGITNATEEFFVRKRPLYEVVGQLGLYGTLINGVQAAGLEHGAMKLASWNSMTIGLLVAYTSAMFILYTVAPMLYRLASSTYYNLSLLSSDFWGLLFGLFLYHYHPYWLYFIAFAVIISGLVTYFWYSTPEEQGTLNPVAPSYVNKRGAELVVPGSPSMA
ncbi:hypothetical protein DXG01_002308 [Tephrocybe rancida]|nr:hypothetical protein DXG01_002308 [Tephrocybe rancida]